MIKDQTKSGPNFAGHYTIASWGCGSMSCTSFAIVNNITGDVYLPFGAFSVYVSSIDQAEPTVDYRRNSQLLIVVGTMALEKGQDRIGKQYYVWEKNRLRLILFIPDRRFSKGVSGRGAIQQTLGADSP